MKPYNHIFNKSILRAYDIRGIYEENLNEKDAFMIGYFFGLCVRDRLNENTNPRIAVSRDGRLSSKSLAKNLIAGLKKSGMEIIDIGLNATPVLYFSNFHFSCDAAIQVTGSHNPKNYNGFKFVMFNKSFYGNDILKLATFAKQGSEKNFLGHVIKKNIQDVYINYITKSLNENSFKYLKNKHIVWDCGNGATGNLIQSLIKNIPGKHTILFSEIDGNFPNHHPDPTNLKNLTQLIKEVINQEAEIGIAFDGDGDRIGIVDKYGKLVPGDLLTAFLTLSLEKKGANIILDIKSSLLAKKLIEKNGFKVDFWRTGHSNIKSRIKEIKSPLAGEMSGHIFFADKYLGYDDAIYTSLRILELLNNGYKIEEFLDQADKSFCTPEIKIMCSEEKKFLVINKISKKLQKKYDNDDILLIDGIRVNNDLGWYLLRASNTENAIICRAEGFTEINKKKLISELSDLLLSEKIILEKKDLIKKT